MVNGYVMLYVKTGEVASKLTKNVILIQVLFAMTLINKSLAVFCTSVSFYVFSCSV